MRFQLGMLWDASNFQQPSAALEMAVFASGEATLTATV